MLPLLWLRPSRHTDPLSGVRHGVQKFSELQTDPVNQPIAALPETEMMSSPTETA
jgi:hypothetical protein